MTYLQLKKNELALQEFKMLMEVSSNEAIRLEADKYINLLQ